MLRDFALRPERTPNQICGPWVYIMLDGCVPPHAELGSLLDMLVYALSVLELPLGGWHQT